MASLETVTARIQALTAQNEKAAAEQAAALQKVREEVANAGNSTPELDAALDALGASIQREDDLNADAPVVDGGDGGDGGAVDPNA